MVYFNSQGSWEKRIIERVHNSRKRAASDCDDPTDTSTPKAKRGRPKMQSVLNRYPPLTLHEDPDGTSQDALDKQLERPTPKKESVLPLQRKTFAVRRRFILSESGTMSVTSVLQRHKVLSVPFAVSACIIIDDRH